MRLSNEQSCLSIAPPIKIIANSLQISKHLAHIFEV